MKRISIDFSKADGYGVTDDALLERKLKSHTLYSDDYLYTIIDGTRLEEFMGRGTYRKDDVIFAFKRDQLVFTDSSESFDLNEALSEYAHPAMAVYKAACFTPVSDYDYRFNDPNNKVNALEAIVLFKGLFVQADLI